MRIGLGWVGVASFFVFLFFFYLFFSDTCIKNCYALNVNTFTLQLEKKINELLTQWQKEYKLYLLLGFYLYLHEFNTFYVYTDYYTELVTLASDGIMEYCWNIWWNNHPHSMELQSSFDKTPQILTQVIRLKLAGIRQSDHKPSD